MKTVAFGKILPLLLPVVAGAVGGFLATAYPAIHQALCLQVV